MGTADAGKLWIGPAGWSYADWHGTVYPVSKPRGFQALSFVAKFFRAVEVNTSFYRLPSAEMTARWVELVPDEFRFSLKLTQTFTHAGNADFSDAEVRAFHDALRPLREAGKLGPLLIQFPWSHRHTRENVTHMQRLADSFADQQRVFEVRHASWNSDEARAELASLGGICNIDQPALRDCLGPAAHVSGRTAYVRLHGRNAPMWFADGVPGYQRYNYTYSDTELRAWVDRIHQMVREAEQVYVIANNHYRGQGVANALELAAMLTDRKVEVPATLLETYPRLARIASPPEQPLLFDS